MRRTTRLTEIAMTAVFGVAACLFFALKCSYPLYFQELNQMFLWTWDYFVSVISEPGGFADWIGRFFTQFCRYTWPGAIAWAILIVLVQLSSYAAMRRRDGFAWGLSFVPAAATWVAFVDCDVLTGSATAVILSLLAAWGIGSIKPGSAKDVISMIMIAVMYMLCGPLCVVYVICAIIWKLKECKGAGKWIWAACAIAVAAVLPLLAQQIFPHELHRLYQGLHYYRNPDPLCWKAWMIGIGAIISAILCAFLPHRDGKYGLVISLIIWIAALACGWVIASRSISDTARNNFTYDRLVRDEDWDGILQYAKDHSVKSHIALTCFNLALSEKGRLAEDMFKYEQDGPSSLIGAFNGDNFTPISTGEIMFRLGLINQAQRYFFEAQESIPDHQKSARMYSRLAETNLINGYYEASRKYLTALTHTMFYSKWAKERLAIVGDDKAIMAVPQYATARMSIPQKFDSLFNIDEISRTLMIMASENPDNNMAFEYALAYCLLQKDLETFGSYMGAIKFSRMPTSYQEAFLIFIGQHTGKVGVTVQGVSDQNVKRFAQFISDYKAKKSVSDMQRMYAGTYWFYYYFRNKKQ